MTPDTRPLLSVRGRAVVLVAASIGFGIVCATGVDFYRAVPAVIVFGAILVVLSCFE